jgi:hypothetical protein
MKIEKSEIQRILEMHSKEKKSKILIKEQSSNQQVLQDMVNKGCVPRGVVVGLSFAAPKDYAIKQEMKNTPGDFTYYFIDGSVAEKISGGKVKLIKLKWDAAACRSKIAQNTNQAITADLTAKLADLKSREGWIEYSELELPENGMSKQGADQGKYGDPKIFDLGGGKSVKLYKKPGAEGVTNKGYTKDQTDIIQKYHDKGYKLKDELTSDELDWKFQKISVKGLPEDWGMYVDPSGIAQKADATDFEELATKQSMDLKTCKNKLDSYYDAFLQKRVFPVSTFNSMKETVQACVNEYTVKGWGGLRPGHFRDMVDVMKGGKGGPSSYGPDSKWKLQ